MPWRWLHGDVRAGGQYTRVKKITTELCDQDLSKSTVSHPCHRLDEQVGAWAERPPYWLYPGSLPGASGRRRGG